jgi:hypothetical protein
VSRLSSLGVGDIIKSKRTLRVTDVTPAGNVYFADVQNGKRFAIVDQSTEGSWSFDLIAKAPKPRPKVGDKISGEVVRDTKWKRGTVIKAPVHIYVLTEDGDWYSPGAHGHAPLDLQDTRVSSRYLAAAGVDFEVVYLP